MTARSPYLSSMILASLLWALPGAVHGQGTSPDGEAEEASDTGNFVEVGAGYLDTDSNYYGRDSGLTDSGLKPLLDFRIEAFPEWDEDSINYWRLEGRRVAWESRHLELEAGQQSRQRFDFSYRQMPRYGLEGARTPFQGVGSEFLSLPGDWETSGNQTDGMIGLDDNLNVFDFKTTRKRADFGYWRRLAERFEINADYRREEKDGRRVVAGIFGFTGGNPRGALMPAPVDYVTDIIDLSLEFNGNDYMIGVGYHGSFFGNKSPALSWENPFGAHPQWQAGTGFPDGVGMLSLFPDNRFNQSRVYGTWNFSPRIQFSGHLAIGRMEQDEPLLAYTVNPLIDIGTPLPRANAEARIDTTLADLRLNARPTNRLGLVVSYRFNDRDNKTPRSAFQGVGGDSQAQVPAEQARINLPYSYRQQSLKADANWRFARRTRLNFGLGYTENDRDDFAEVSSIDEWVAKLGLRTRAMDNLTFSINYEYADRTTSDYEGRNPYLASHVPGTIGPEDFENHPNLRKYNLAERTRDQVNSRVDFNPLETVNLGASASYSKDDYDDRFFGLTEASVASYTLDAGYVPNEQVSVTGFLTEQRYHAGQSGRDFPPGQHMDPDRDWLVDHDDRVNVIGANLELKDVGTLINFGLGRRLDFGMDFVFSRSRTEIDVSTGPALSAEPLPDAVSKLSSYGLWLRYHLTRQGSIRASFEHERFSSRNFALDETEVDSLANILLFGSGSPNYTANWFGLSFHQRF